MSQRLARRPRPRPVAMCLSACLSCLVLLLGGASVSAQEFRGSIEGRVVDESKASVPGVSVVATNLATGVITSGVTNEEGLFLLPLLPPGRYKVAFELQGFKRVDRENVEVRVDDRVAIDTTLSLGRMEEVITVQADTPLLESTSGSAGQVIDEKRIELMPLSDGNPFTMTRLTAGVVPFGDLRYFRPFDNNATAEFSAAGGTTANAYTLDGAPNQAHRQGNADSRMAFTPPASAVQEFKVQTVTFDAQQGRSSGATVNVAMKSGTNTYKGESYFYYRGEELSKTEFFTRRNNNVEPTLDYNRYGFAGGGPVQLGKLYNGRNRTFFFTAVEWLKDKFPNSSTQTVPTEKQRNGDFSELLSQNIRIYDPNTAFVNAAGQVERLPFANNIIPADRISPIAREILKYYPMPNRPGDAQGRNNYFANVTRNDDFATMNFRVDHQVSANHKVFGRYSHNNRRETSGHWLEEINGVRPTGFFNWRVNDTLGLDYVWTMSPSSLLNVRASWGKFHEFDRRQHQDTFDPASLGFSPDTVSLFRGFRYFPQMDLNTYSDLGNNYLGGITTNQYNFQPTWTKLTGAHSIRSGYDLRFTREDEGFDGHPAGLYQFRGDFTRQAQNSSSQHGQDLAAMMLGLATGGRIEVFGDRFNQVIYQGLFAQDDWKVSDRLTLNLGVRYEYEGAPTERFNRNVRGFDADAPLTITAAAEAAYAAQPIPEVPASAFRARGGVGFVSEDTRGFWDADRNNIQPRLGFAYRMTEKTLLRGGWAMFTAPATIDGARLLGLNRQTNIAASLDAGRTFVSSLFNPFPNGVLEPEGQGLGPNTQLGLTVDRFFNDVAFRNGNLKRWVLTLQRELPGRWVAEASYIAARGSELRTNVQLNGIPTEFLSRSATRDQAHINRMDAFVPNPFRGLLPNDATFNANTIRVNRLVRPFPQFNGLAGRRYDGSSRYDSMQLKLDKRFSGGFSFLTSYTFSRALERVSRLNEMDTAYEERPSRSDSPHRIVINPIWELPFGRGRRFASEAGPLMNALVGGWSVAAVWQWQQGEPINIGNLYYNGDIRQLKAHISPDGITTPVFDTSGFYFHDAEVMTNGVIDPAKQRGDDRIDLNYNFRTLPSRVSNLRGTPLRYMDVSIVKRAELPGRARLQFHVEFYNATDYPWFNTTNINMDPSSANFGLLTSTRNLPFNLQLGAKIFF